MSGAVWRRGRDELLHELRELQARMWRDYSAALRLISELEVRNAAAESGYRSLRELLRDALRITPREAARRIAHANALNETPLVSGGSVPASLPATAAAAANGALGPDHIHEIAQALTALPPHIEPDAVADAERTMVTAAASMDARTLAKLGARVRAVLDQDGTPPSDAELANPVNELHLTTRPNGRTALRGELEPEASAQFRSLLGALARPRPTAEEGPDQRSTAERNGDALADLVRLAAASADAPTEAGEKPHVLVTVPLQVLRDGLGTALLDGAGDLDAAVARRIACDCKVIPAVLGSGSEPLDLGRAVHTVPTALRRALVLRDGGCAFPGCDRPHRWCHSHHIQHWVDGGTTDLPNLVLLCGHHHRLVHHSEWTCAITDGRATFRPPRFIDPARTPRHNTLHPLRQ